MLLDRKRHLGFNFRPGASRHTSLRMLLSMLRVLRVLRVLGMLGVLSVLSVLRRV